MKAFFFIFLTPLLIVFQTVIFPSFPIFANCFDLLIINILYLSLIARHNAMILAIILIGVIMDSISGVPFFYYTFSYLFIYIIVHLFKQFLFKQSTVFITIISLVSVLVQQVLLIFIIFVKQGVQDLAFFEYRLLVWQLFWGVLIIPPGVWFLNVCLNIWIRVVSELKKQLIKKIEE